MPDLPHLAARLLGTPLLLAQPKLDLLLRTLAPRLLGAGALPPAPAPLPPPPAPVVTGDGIAVVPVTGTLVTRSAWLGAASGLTSYPGLAATLADVMADPAVRAVLLEVDSPGGEAGGLFDLVETVRELKAERAKPLWAVASEQALSAAYALASTADRLWVTRTGMVGSIGVVAVHLDESGADTQAGLGWTFIHAGERKVDGNPHQPLSPRARAAIQADVDALHADLVALVARNRTLAPEAVRATEAATYRGARGLEPGLADAVGTTAQALTALASTLRPSAPPTPPRLAAAARLAATGPSTRRPETAMTDPAPLHEPAALPEPDPPPEPAPRDLPAPAADPPLPPAEPPRPAAPAGLESRLRAELAELLAIGSQAARLGVEIDPADAMARGLRPDALRRAVLDQLAARAEAGAVLALVRHPATTADGESPIVRRAKLRAQAG